MSKAKKESVAGRVSLADIQPVVEFVGGFVADSDAVPSFQYLFFSKGAVYAFNGWAGARWAAPWLPDGVVVAGARLKRALADTAGLGDEAVSLSVTERRIVMRAGQFESGIPRLPPGVEAPAEYILREPPAGRVKLDDRFWADLARVEFAAASDEVMAAVRGVFWAPDGSLVATDNLRLALCSPGKAGCKAPGTGVLIPRHLLRAVGPRPAFTDAAVEETAVWFLQAGGAAYGQLFQEPFPAERALGFFKTVRELAGAEKKNTGTWATLAEDAQIGRRMDRLLGQAAALENPGGGIRVDVAAKSVKFVIGQEVKDEVRADVKGPAASFIVNGGHLKDALTRVGRTFWYAPGGPPLYFVDPAASLEHLVGLLAG